VLAGLLDEVVDFPDVAGTSADGHDPAEEVVLLLRLASPEGELNLLSTVATFGAPHDITTSELAIESFFPADEPTAAILRARGSTPEQAVAGTAA
jgi:hypothetical protein